MRVQSRGKTEKSGPKTAVHPGANRSKRRSPFRANALKKKALPTPRLFVFAPNPHQLASDIVRIRMVNVRQTIGSGGSGRTAQS